MRSKIFSQWHKMIAVLAAMLSLIASQPLAIRSREKIAAPDFRAARDEAGAIHSTQFMQQRPARVP
jgi:hypothetical protein